MELNKESGRQIRRLILVWHNYKSSAEIAQKAGNVNSQISWERLAKETSETIYYLSDCTILL